MTATVALAVVSFVPPHVSAQDVLVETYILGADSQVNENVPHGVVTQHQWLQSTVFPGTKRNYSVYVPAQYDGSQPAALMVFQDGHAFQGTSGEFRLPVVFDNLIARGDMPVTIAVMIDPGYKSELPAKRGWRPRPENRSFEYDSVTDDYARFLLTEILPEIEQDYQITQNPELRAICGNSSGGICAFSVAWFRPNSFRKVLSHIGSFVDLRGGHSYPPMIRKADKKPIRVFLQDGENDLDNQFGNWPLANRQMAKALEFKDYDYRLVMGSEAHNGKHGGAIFPDSLRWLWRDWKDEVF